MCFLVSDMKTTDSQHTNQHTLDFSEIHRANITDTTTVSYKTFKNSQQMTLMHGSIHLRRQGFSFTQQSN